MPRGHPVRGFFGGLFLGLFVDLDLAFAGAVKTDSVVLTIIPVALLVIGLILGFWAPIGRSRNTSQPLRSPLPPPVAWPEHAPVEGSTTPSAPAQWSTPPPVPPVNPVTPAAPPASPAGDDTPPPPPPSTPSI